MRSEINKEFNRFTLMIKDPEENNRYYREQVSRIREGSVFIMILYLIKTIYNCISLMHFGKPEQKLWFFA